MKIKPFLVSSGGKTKMLKLLLNEIPENFNTYCEPFVGGGALFLALKHNKCIVNDLNSDIIDIYKYIANDYKIFFSMVDELKEQYDSCQDRQSEKVFFDKVREKFNNIKQSCIQKSALYFFINKYSWGGIIRKNKLGNLTSTCSYRKKNNIYDVNNVLQYVNYVRNNDILFLNDDYKNVVSRLKENDFCFIDSPYDFDGYHPVNYCNFEFGRKEQIELKKQIDELTLKGVKVLATNYCTDFIMDIYRSYNLKVKESLFNFNPKNVQKKTK